MSKHKLILKEAELVDLITYTVLDIQEQRIGYDVMIDAQHKRDYGGDDSGSSVLGDWWEKLKSYYDPGSEDSYHHGINQSLAIVFYAANKPQNSVSIILLEPKDKNSWVNFLWL